MANFADLLRRQKSPSLTLHEFGLNGPLPQWQLGRHEYLVPGDYNMWLNDTKRAQATIEQLWKTGIALGSPLRTNLARLVPRTLKSGPNKGALLLDVYTADGQFFVDAGRHSRNSATTKHLQAESARGRTYYAELIMREYSDGIAVGALMPLGRKDWDQPGSW